MESRLLQVPFQCFIKIDFFVTVIFSLCPCRFSVPDKLPLLLIDVIKIPTPNQSRSFLRGPPST